MPDSLWSVAASSPEVISPWYTPATCMSASRANGIQAAFASSISTALPSDSLNVPRVTIRTTVLPSGLARRKATLEAVDDGLGELRAFHLGGAVHQPGEVVRDDLLADRGL